MNSHNTCTDSSCSPGKETPSKKKKTSPRRWFVLISGYFVMFLSTGFPYNIYILNPEFMRTFQSNKAETALVQAITTGMIYIAGTFCREAVSRYGARVTGICGSMLVTFGLVSSFFAQSIPHLILALGLVSGIGFSATFISAVTSVGEYFEGKSQLMALSFLTFGMGCGDITSSFLLHFLIGEFGWRGCLLVVGGLMANMACLFAVCRPVSIGLQQLKANPLSKVDSEKTPTEHSFKKSLRSLFTNKVYIAHISAMCCTLPVIDSSLIFMTDFLTTKGFDPKTATSLYRFLQIGNALFGVVPGLCKMYIPHTSVLIIPACFTIIGSLVNAFLPHAETYTQYAVLLLCLGMTLGVSNTTVSVTTVKIVALQDYSASLGILMTLIGIGDSVFGPIAGLFVDLTGSYKGPFYCMSSGLGLATGLFLLAAVLKRRSNNKNSDLDVTIAVGTDNPVFSI